MLPFLHASPLATPFFLFILFRQIFIATHYDYIDYVIVESAPSNPCDKCTQFGDISTDSTTFDGIDRMLLSVKMTGDKKFQKISSFAHVGFLLKLK